MGKHFLFMAIIYTSSLFSIPFGPDGKNASSNIAISDTLLAQQYYTQAENFAGKARFDSANSNFKQASTIYKALAQNYDDLLLWEKYINCLNSIGNNFNIISRFEESKNYLEEALALGLELFGENHPVVATSYFNPAKRGIKIFDRDKTLHYSRKSLEILDG